MPTLLYGLIALVMLIILAVVVISTLRFKASPAEFTEPLVICGDKAGAQKLSRTIQIMTISHPGGEGTDWSAFTAFHDVGTAFPLVSCPLPANGDQQSQPGLSLAGSGGGEAHPHHRSHGCGAGPVGYRGGLDLSSLRR